MKFDIDKKWCEDRARAEDDHDVSAGMLAAHGSRAFDAMVAARLDLVNRMEAAGGTAAAADLLVGAIVEAGGAAPPSVRTTSHGRHVVEVSVHSVTGCGWDLESAAFAWLNRARMSLALGEARERQAATDSADETT